MYWALTTLTTVGYGDIHPTTRAETAFGILMLLVFTSLFPAVIGTIAAAQAKLGERRSRHERKMDYIRKYVENDFRGEKLSNEVVERVMNYYEYRWSNQHGTSETLIIKQLPPALRATVVLEMAFGALSSVSLFRTQIVLPHLSGGGPGAGNRDRSGSGESSSGRRVRESVSLGGGAASGTVAEPLVFNSAFMRAVAAAMEPVMLMPLEVLLRRGEMYPGMYVVYQGELECVDVGGANGKKKKKQGQVLLSVKEGECLGETNLMFPRPSESRVRCNEDTHADIFLLPHAAFARVLDRFVDLRKPLRRAAREKMQSKGDAEKIKGNLANKKLAKMMQLEAEQAGSKGRVLDLPNRYRRRLWKGTPLSQALGSARVTT